MGSLEDLPEHVRFDKRLPGIREKFTFGKVTNTEGTREYVIPLFLPDCDGLEIVSLTQFETWPVSVSSEIVATDMENVKEKPAPAKEEVKVEEKKEEAKAEEKKEEKKESTELVSSDKDNVPAKSGGAGKAVVIILVLLVIAYMIAVVYCDMDFTLSKLLQ